MDRASICLDTVWAPASWGYWIFSFCTRNVFRGSNCIYSVSCVTVVEMPFSKSELSSSNTFVLSSVWRILRKHSCLAEQIDLYLGIKILTTAIFYYGFSWLFCMTWNYQTLQHMHRLGHRGWGGEAFLKNKWVELHLKISLSHFNVSIRFTHCRKSQTEVPQNLWLPYNRWKWKILLQAWAIYMSEAVLVNCQTYLRALSRTFLDEKKYYKIMLEKHTTHL